MTLAIPLECVVRPGRWARVWAAAVGSISLAGCIVVPLTQDVYDAECRIYTRQITLEAAYLGGFHRCAGEGCVALLVSAGVVTAASVVVSGSIAVVGNVVYWVERQGRCARQANPPADPGGNPRAQPPLILPLPPASPGSSTPAAPAAPSTPGGPPRVPNTTAAPFGITA